MSHSSTEADEQTVRNLASAISHGIAPAALAAADPAAAAALRKALLTHPSTPAEALSGIPRVGLAPKPPAARDGSLDPENALDDREFAEHPEDHETTLESVDLMKENIRLYRQTRRLLSKVLVDTVTPSNQKAQVINALSSILKGLTAQQTDIYNAERLKRLESAVIDMLKMVPEDAQKAFLERYETEVNVR
jgi:hypothetical protein